MIIVLKHLKTNWVVKCNIVLQLELYTHNIVITVEDQCIILYLFWLYGNFLSGKPSRVSLTSIQIDNRYIMYHTSIVFPTVAIIHDVRRFENWRNDWTSNVFQAISQRPSHTTYHTSTRIVLRYLYVYMHKCVYLHSRRVHTWYRYVI